MASDNLDETTRLHNAARKSYQEIFKAHTAFTDADFEQLKFLQEPMVENTAFAMQKRIIQQVGNAPLTANTILFNVDY